MPRHHFDGNDPANGKSQDKAVVKPASRQSGTPVTQTQNADKTYGSPDAPAAGTGRPVKGLRFVSGLIDLIVMVFLYFIVLVILMVASIADEGLSGEGAFIFYTIYISACFAYGLFMESSHLQGTLGKIMTGTVIVNKEGKRISFGQALGRNFGKWLSFLIPFYIAYLMVLFTQRSQSLHDLMAGTLVYKKGDVPQSYAETFA